MYSGSILSLKEESPAQLKEALFEAVKRGDNLEIGKLVAAGVNINETDSNRQNVLHLAAVQGHTKTLDYLIDEHNMDIHAVVEYAQYYIVDDGYGSPFYEDYTPDEKPGEGRNVLHYAAIGGHIRTIDHLILRYKMDIHLEDAEGETAYTLAVLNQKEEMAKHFLKKYDIKPRSSPKLEALLREAAKQGDHTKIDYLIQHGTNINAKESRHDGKTAYIIAILAGKRKTARYLKVKYNAILESHPELEEKLLKAINPLDKDTIDYLISCHVNACKALHYAAQTYNIEAIDYFVEQHDIDINMKDEKGETAYTLAAARYYKEMVDYLLKKGAVKPKFSVKLQEALCEAAMHSSNSVIDYLIACGADVNIEIKVDLGKDKWLLYKAVENGEKADVNAESLPCNHEIKRNALYYAVINDRIDTIEHLVKHCKIDVKIKDNQGETVLHWVATKGQFKTFHYLLSTYTIDISVENSKGWTAYTLAVLNNKKEIADYLLEKCDVKKESSLELEFALLKAAERGDNARIDYLVIYGANVHAIGKHRQTQWPYCNLRDPSQNALHRAAANGHMATVKHLLEHYHMDVNVEDDKGETAYTLAIANKKNEIADYLKREHDIKLKSSSKLEITLREASKRGDNTKIDYCVENGVNLNAEDDEGETAYTLAVVNNKTETAEYLQIKYSVKLKSSPRLEQALLTAASQGDNARIDYLVTCGVNIHAKVNKGENALYRVNSWLILSSPGQNALHRAAINGHRETLDYLIEHYGMDVHEQNAEGETVYTLAVASRKKEFAEYVKTKYAIKLKSSPQLEEALFQAIRDGNNAEIDYFVSCGANINTTRENVLHIAAYNGHIETLDYLIKHYHLNINQENEKGETAYTLAVSHNEKEMAKHLREKYRRKLSLKSSPRLEQALFTAARAGDNAQIDCLVECGANIHTTADLEGYEPEEDYEGIEGGGDGRNVLHWAAVEGHTHTVKHMISHHHMMVNAEDDRGETAYTLALANDKKKTALYLREQYAVRLKTSEKLEGLLWNAAERCDHDEIDYLIACGANVNAKNYWGDTVLHRLASNGQAKTIGYLVSTYKMYVNLKNNEGKTPLMLAIFHHQKDTISYLKKKETEQDASVFHYAVKEKNRTLLISACSSSFESINITNSKGDTALHLAVRCGNVEFSKILILHGADVCMKNKEKKSPQGMLIDKRESYFSTESKKWLLALMLMIEPFDLSNHGFTADFSRDMTQKRDILLLKFKFSRKEIASIISKKIISSNPAVKLDKAMHKKSFKEMNEISYLSPLLGITAFAVEGMHELAFKLKSENKKLRIIIDPEQSCTATVTLGDSSNACGVYYHDNSIYLGGKRHADEEMNRDLVRGTLIHEITHFVADEVFKNNSIPYAKDDLESKKWFNCIVERIYHEFKREPKSMPEIIACVFSGSYTKEVWEKELIVRIPQLIAMGELRVVRKFCPDLLQYYNEKFLIDCKSHLLNLHYKNRVFLSYAAVLIEKKSAKTSSSRALFEFYEPKTDSESDDEKYSIQQESSQYVEKEPLFELSLVSDYEDNLSGDRLQEVTSPCVSAITTVSFWRSAQSNSASSSSAVQPILSMKNSYK